ncbi:hypothetical protein [Devosia riboflavina]|nr:hypothetical protein [Devosia riboflavina]
MDSTSNPWPHRLSPGFTERQLRFDRVTLRRNAIEYAHPPWCGLQ